MSCLNLLEMFKGRKVVIPVEPKRGPGRPKKARVELDIVVPEHLADVEPHAFEVTPTAQQRAPDKVEIEESLAMVPVTAFESPVKMTPREYGLRGASYGALGGRPRKSLSGLESPNLQMVEVQTPPTSNRKSLSSLPKRDETFGVLAKLEICTMVETHLPAFEKAGHSLSDLFRAISKQTGRDVKKVKFAFENKEKWLEEQKRLRLGQGSRQSLRMRGVKSNTFSKFSVARGLRASGGGCKAHLEELHPSMRLWFEKVLQVPSLTLVPWSISLSI